jgi:hypothetical protein
VDGDIGHRVDFSGEGERAIGFTYGSPACAGAINQQLSEIVLAADPMDVAIPPSRRSTWHGNSPISE